MALTGANEVPPVTTDAFGFANVNVADPDTHFEGAYTMTAEQTGWFEDGLLCINLHSVANPGGGIRGQIVP